QVAKAVLLAGPEEYFVAVLPATMQVNTDLLAEALGGPVRLADTHEMTSIFRDCEWGVVAPFGTLYGLATVMEESLNPEAMLVLEGGSHGEAVRMRGGDFMKLEKPARLRFAK